MDAISSSSQAFDFTNGGFTKEGYDDGDAEIPAVDSFANHSNPTTELLPSHQLASRSICNGGRITKKKKRAVGDVSGSSCSSHSTSSKQKGLLLSRKRRIPKVVVGGSGRCERDLEALGLPLGMSIAAVVAQNLRMGHKKKHPASRSSPSSAATPAVPSNAADYLGSDEGNWSVNLDPDEESRHKPIVSLIEDPNAKQRHLRNAIEFAHFYANLLYEVSNDGKGCLAKVEELVTVMQKEEEELVPVMQKEKDCAVKNISEAARQWKLKRVVLDRKNAEDRISVDHLSMICTSAVRESLANVFGDRFDCFTRSFEKSFRSTLRTLRLLNEASMSMGDLLSNSSIENHSSEVASPTSLNKKECPSSNSGINDCHSEAILPSGNQEPFRTVEETPENMKMDPMNLELTLHGQINQQMACVFPRRLGSGINPSMMLSTFEKSVMEQARSNDLKTFEIGLVMKRLQLKESQLALNSDSNLLERVKISMGISKASFRNEKFKNQLEDTRHAELLTKCVDCLVAGLLIMSASLVYGAYIYSYQRITEATASCSSSRKETKSWWIPNTVSSFNSGLHTLRCQALVVTRMLFGVLMILAIACLLLQRSGASKQTMPVTFILLLLGIVCGLMGKLCVETLGGNGSHWLFYWEVLCLLHFIANICTSTLFLILHGHVSASQGAEGNAMFPYWIRRFLFYGIMLLFLPLSCGLFPFASPSDWREHFSLLLADTLLSIRGIEA
ncbi:hypothetical protein HHK36_008022 [Tetracentron sinense]|uniref:Protein CPR-5 n=1 Tax=Tetracentron sinense TaxID=13715 RepID=A0A834ZET4_TETSI|nr:hypothetical protein HHK36_008022 [Tetracentron sinense]